MRSATGAMLILVAPGRNNDSGNGSLLSSAADDVQCCGGSPSSPHRRDHRRAGLAGLAWAGGFLALVPWVIGLLLPPLNGDVAAILFFAVRMVAGDRLYVDLTDVNPPLIFLLNLPAAWLSARLGVPAGMMFMGQVLVLAAAAAVLAWHLLRPQGPRVWTLWLFVFVLVVLPWRDAGQREHLMVVLALPWLALVARRLAGQPTAAVPAIGIAGLAAVGFLIKPYFWAVPAAAELLMAQHLGWRRWRVRPEPVVFLVLGVAYAAVVLTVFPAYLDTVVPAAERHYAATGLVSAVQNVLGDPWRWALPVGLAALAGPARRRPFAAAAWCLGIGGLAAALLQGKGWPYHLVPAWSGLALCAGSLAVERLGRIPALPAGAIAAALSVAYAWGHPPLAAPLAYAGSPEQRLAACIGAAARGEPVMWLGEAVWPEYPALLYAHAKPGMADMDLWLLGTLYRTRGPGYAPLGRQGADEAVLFQRVLGALARRRPSVVVVEPVPIDFLAYFRRAPGFERLWSDYRELGRIGDIRLFARGAGAGQLRCPASIPAAGLRTAAGLR